MKTKFCLLFLALSSQAFAASTPGVLPQAVLDFQASRTVYCDQIDPDQDYGSGIPIVYYSCANLDKQEFYLLRYRKKNASLTIKQCAHGTKSNPMEDAGFLGVPYLISGAHPYLCY